MDNTTTEDKKSFVETKTKKDENGYIWFLPSIFLAGFLLAWFIRGTFLIDEDVPVKRAHNIIDKNFYKHKTDSEKLYYNAIEGMIKALDDEYSSYYPPAEVGDFDKATTGEFAGIGVQISLDSDNHLRIITPLPNSPALEAGIKTGDKILKVNGRDATYKSSQDAVEELSGVEGSKVVLTIKRWKTDEIKEITVTRKTVISPSVVGAKSIDVNGKKIGYVRLKSFQNNSADDLEAEISNLVSNSQIRGLILDIRFNRGGQLMIVNQIVDFFLPKNKLIVYTLGRNADNTFSYKTIDDEKFKDLPLVVLVNGYSASASEILAGALQDHKRAIIVGERTYGKGKVQNVYPLEIFEKDSKLKLTTSLYFTPSGRCIQKSQKNMYCPKCIRIFNESDYPEFEFCPFDNTPLELLSAKRFYRGGIQPDINLPTTLHQRNFIVVKQYVEEIIGYPPFVTEEDQNILSEELGDEQLDAAIAIFKNSIPNSKIKTFDDSTNDE